MIWLSIDFNQNGIDMFAQLKHRSAKSLFEKLKSLYAFFKIANQHIIFDNFCLHHLDSLWILGTKIYHSKQFILLSVHRIRSGLYETKILDFFCTKFFACVLLPGEMKKKEFLKNFNF